MVNKFTKMRSCVAVCLLLICVENFKTYTSKFVQVLKSLLKLYLKKIILKPRVLVGTPNNKLVKAKKINLKNFIFPRSSFRLHRVITNGITIDYSMPFAYNSLAKINCRKTNAGVIHVHHIHVINIEIKMSVVP